MYTQQRLVVPMFFVWTQKSTTSLFHVGTGPLRTAALIQARATEVELMGPSSLVRAVPGYQTCNDPSLESNWGNTTQLGAGGFLNVAEITYNSSWVDLSSSLGAVRYIRFGFLVKNNSGTAIEHTMAGMNLDLRWT